MCDKRYYIKLSWIASHFGITGNEIADSYAKKASHGIDTQLKILFNDK